MEILVRLHLYSSPIHRQQAASNPVMSLVLITLTARNERHYMLLHLLNFVNGTKQSNSTQKLNGLVPNDLVTIVLLGSRVLFVGRIFLEWKISCIAFSLFSHPAIWSVRLESLCLWQSLSGAKFPNKRICSNLCSVPLQFNMINLVSLYIVWEGWLGPTTRLCGSDSFNRFYQICIGITRNALQLLRNNS